MAQPSLGLQMRSDTVQVRFNALLYIFLVGRVNPVEQFLRTVADFGVRKTEHGLPARGKIKRVIH